MIFSCAAQQTSSLALYVNPFSSNKQRYNLVSCCLQHVDWCQVVFDLPFCVPRPNKTHKCNWIQGTDLSSMHSWVSKLSDAHKSKVNIMNLNIPVIGRRRDNSQFVVMIKSIEGFEMDRTWIWTWQLLIDLGSYTGYSDYDKF